MSDTERQAELNLLRTANRHYRELADLCAEFVEDLAEWVQKAEEIIKDGD